jgi:hypothetical protein
MRSLHAVSFVADFTELQSVWERSGKFEGDIMLTEGQVSNSIINPARHWPSRAVPFFIDRVFSEYCSSKIQSGLRDMEGIINHCVYRLDSNAHWSLSGRSNGDNYLTLPPQNLTHSYALTCKARHVNIPTILRPPLRQIAGYY